MVFRHIFMGKIRMVSISIFFYFIFRHNCEFVPEWMGRWTTKGRISWKKKIHSSLKINNLVLHKTPVSVLHFREFADLSNRCTCPYFPDSTSFKREKEI